jgi:hypothetical protein
MSVAAVQVQELRSKTRDRYGVSLWEVEWSIVRENPNCCLCGRVFGSTTADWDTLEYDLFERPVWRCEDRGSCVEAARRPVAFGKLKLLDGGRGQ